MAESPITRKDLIDVTGSLVAIHAALTALAAAIPRESRGDLSDFYTKLEDLSGRLDSIFSRLIDPAREKQNG